MELMHILCGMYDLLCLIRCFVTVKADEEMKREQERRVTEDKKNTVQQQLLHTVGQYW